MKFKGHIVNIVVFLAIAGLMAPDIAPAYDQFVYKIQSKLKSLGYNPGPVDGIWGPKTEEAVKAFQYDSGLAATGRINRRTKTKLDLETSPSPKRVHKAGRVGQSDRLSASAGHPKVGYINLQRLVNESRMGLAARSELHKLRREKEALVAEKLLEVNELRDLINKAGDKMAPQEKRDKLLSLQKANKEYQRLVSDVKADILREDRQLVSIILQKADGVLKKVAKRLDFTIILKDATAIGYLAPSVDITDEVIKELDQRR
jgi:outer membrane protein